MAERSRSSRMGYPLPCLPGLPVNIGKLRSNGHLVGAQTRALQHLPVVEPA
jgi:hypothetical protein